MVSTKEDGRRYCGTSDRGTYQMERNRRSCLEKDLKWRTENLRLEWREHRTDQESQKCESMRCNLVGWLLYSIDRQTENKGRQRSLSVSDPTGNGPDEDEPAGYKQNAASKHTSNPARGGIVWWRRPLFVSHTGQLDRPTLQRDVSSGDCYRYRPALGRLRVQGQLLLMTLTSGAYWQLLRRHLLVLPLPQVGNQKSRPR